MKIDKLKNRKLGAYSAMAAVITGVPHADAQIVYTDVTPDFQIEFGNLYWLDIDDNGSTDFELYNHKFYENINLGISAYAGNEIVGYSDGVEAAVENYASVLDEGVEIGPSLDWLPDVFGTNLQAALWATHPWGSYGSYGLWDNVNDKYVGLRFKIGAAWHYGWARLTVTHTTITLKDYAYNSLDNQPINIVSTSIQTQSSDFNPILIVDEIGVAITLPSTGQKTSFALFDMSGHLVSARMIQNEDFIQLTDYSKGIYIIEITQGEDRFVKKIVWN